MHNWLRIIFRRFFYVLGAILATVFLLIIWLAFGGMPSTPRARKLAKVAGLTASVGRGQISISWIENPGAIAYQVLRSNYEHELPTQAGTPFGAPPVRIPIGLYNQAFVRTMSMRWFYFPMDAGRYPGPPFVDTRVNTGHTYYYYVRATDGTGWTGLSNPLKVTLPAGDDQEDTAVKLDIDVNKVVGPFEHKWEETIGSERLTYMLKGDVNAHIRNAGQGLQSALALCHTAIGVRYVLSHGILMDDVGIFKMDERGVPAYDWSKLDQLYDLLLSKGLRPFVQFTFMPENLAADPNAIKGKFYSTNISPPKDYEKWSALVRAFATHLIERYGKSEVEQWPFSVWNQPDIRVWWRPWWAGSDEDYYRLYDYTATALKDVDPRIRVGGPVSYLPGFVEPFIRHVTTHNYATGGNRTPIDFLDVRKYGASADNWKPILARYGLADLPVFYTEWGPSIQAEMWGDTVTDTPYGAAWIVNELQESYPLTSSIAYWRGSDYFEEHGPPKQFFHGGFGLIGLEGIRKPAFWAFYLLHLLGNTQIAMKAQGDGANGLVNGWATIAKKDASVRVIVSNVTRDQGQSGGNLTLRRHIYLTVHGCKAGEHFQLHHYRIDNDHSNVYAEWQSLGSPEWPSPKQLVDLHLHDDIQELANASINADRDGRISIDFALPMPGVSFLLLEPK